MKYLEAFERAVRCHPSKQAIDVLGSHSVTYAELDERTTRFGNALTARIPEQRPATLARNGTLPIEAMLASHKRGIGNVQLPFRDDHGTLVSMLEPTNVGLIVFDDTTVEEAIAVLERTEIEHAIHAGTRSVDHPAVEPYEAVLETASDDRRSQRDGDEHGVFYTSGTTGVPKGVLFDQEQMWYASVQATMEMGVDERDTALVSTPWYHLLTSASWILPHLQVGATLVVQPDFEPEPALGAVERDGITGLVAVPTQLHMLSETQQRDEFDLESLSYVRTAGSPVSPDLIERTRRQLTETVYNTYGLTEAGPNVTFAHPTAQLEHPGTVGRESFTWEVRVVKAVGPDNEPNPDATVKAGTTGELIARGPGQSEGYLGANEDPFVDGWLRTGDCAERDEDGYLYIVGRVDNMIISGGENVYPEEVEAVVETHDDVEEAAVVGVDDERWGERVACLATLSESTSLDAAELDCYCKRHERLPDFKRPREYVLTHESLPRTETGTLERDRVVSEHFEE